MLTYDASHITSSSSKLSMLMAIAMLEKAQSAQARVIEQLRGIAPAPTEAEYAEYHADQQAQYLSYHA